MKWSQTSEIRSWKLAQKHKKQYTPQKQNTRSMQKRIFFFKKRQLKEGEEVLLLLPGDKDK